MVDLTELEALLSAPAKIQKCPIAKAVDGFEGNLRELANKALAEKNPTTNQYVWSAPKLVNLLNEKAGLSLEKSTMQRHRGGNCSCSDWKGY
jgi:hypothetical protein